MTRSIALFFLLAITPLPIGAAQIPVVNPGFENPILADGGIAAANVNGWGAGGAGFIANPSPSTLPGGIAPQGSNVGYLFNLGESDAYISQIVGTVQAGSYTLSYALARDLSTFRDFNYAAQLLAGASVFAADNNTQSLTYGEIKYASVSGVVPTGSPLIGQPLEIRLIAKPTTDANFVFWDDISLTFTAVPEPSAFLMTATGLALVAGVLCARRSSTRTKKFSPLK